MSWSRAIALIIVLGVPPLAHAQDSRAGSPLRIDRADGTIRTDHLAVVTYASDEVVKAGSELSLVFEITPRARMHVYAPGAEPYQIIRLQLDPHPAVTPGTLEYPPSELYLLEPINERMPVYQKPFVLRQPVVVRPSATGGRQLTIKGTLRYQACDDRVCFAPKSVPVSYSITVR
ncbi:MAG: protein-disulfide reductase DsbD domain-containing protein [Vicinamibacterales bacterium]